MGGTGLAGILQEIEDQSARLERELAEIELLVQQARAEAGRHELRRNQARDRLTALDARRDVTVAEYRDNAAQLATTTGRASLMDAQIDILEGKQKALTRFRDTLSQLRNRLEAEVGWAKDPVAGTVGKRVPAGDGPVPAAFGRAILSAQEDLRRDIARAMHDGPAQSLTNIVLQAEIAHRLMERDPRAAAEEVTQLVRMVQHALDATKNFIFDVRPMVLDDLGLVPTLRRVALDRGGRAGVPIHFESMGQDRRLLPEIESGLYRILDDALMGYLATQAPEVHVELDWTEDAVRSVVRTVWPDDESPAQSTRDPATRDPATRDPATPSRASAGRSRLGRRREAEEMPPALAAMIRDQQDDVAAATQAAADAITTSRALPPSTWREIEHRAVTLGLQVALSNAGRMVEAIAAIPAAADG